MYKYKYSMMMDELVIRSTPEGPAAGAFKLNTKYMSGGNLSFKEEEDGLAVPAGLYLIQSSYYTPYSMNQTEQVIDHPLFERLIKNMEVCPTTRNQSKKKSRITVQSKTRRNKS